MTQLKQRLTSPALALTPSEHKAMRALLDDWPRLGLSPLARFAGRAGVSDPTILRLLKKLGFSGYGAFQQALLADIDERLHSPRTLLAERRAALVQGNPWQAYLENCAENLHKTQDLSQDGDLEKLCGWLLDTRAQVYCAGGRFSRFLAAYLCLHLRHLRSGCHLLDDSVQRAEQLADLGAGDLLLLFDYRRYQSEAALLAAQAKARGARLVLFTDIYPSPLRAEADLIVSAPVEVLSPFDSLLPALAQAEALVYLLSLRMEKRLEQRLDEIERLRQVFSPSPCQEDPSDVKPA